MTLGKQIAFTLLAVACATRPLPVRAFQAAPAATVAPVTLKVTVTISRFNNDKKVGSLPFVLMVIAGTTAGRDGDSTRIQTGGEVPVPTWVSGDNKQPALSYMYRSLGTQVNVASRPIEDGQFNLSLNVTDSQILSDTGRPGPVDPAHMPSFQSFNSSARLLMRDHQTVQYTAAADKTTGDIIKLDVTMDVIK